MTDTVTIVGKIRSVSKVGDDVGIAEAFSRYGSQAEIGAGAMGLVYRVHDNTLNRDVAMKVLKQNVVGDDLVKRFYVEAQIGGQLEHSGLLPIHDLGQDQDGNAFFTMRFVPKHKTLEQIVAQLRAGDVATHTRFSMEERVQIIVRLADTLSYIHGRGVIHRDIKPANILIGDAGEVYLVDLGVATLVDSDRQSKVQTNVREQAIEEGMLVGTLLYMSPEQLLGDPAIGITSDVYSLCVVAYELFCEQHYLGEVPPSSHLAILSAVLDGERVDAERHWNSHTKTRVPRQISRILRWGLNQERESGIPSADALRHALQAWLEGKAPVVCPGTFIQRYLGRWGREIDRRPVLVPLLSMALGLLLTYSLVFTIWSWM